MVCARTITPRHAFVTWIFLQHRTPTEVKLSKFQLHTDTTCSLCNNAEEDEEHLFFKCICSNHLDLITPMVAHTSRPGQQSRSGDRPDQDPWDPQSYQDIVHHLQRSHLLYMEGEEYDHFPEAASTQPNHYSFNQTSS